MPLWLAAASAGARLEERGAARACWRRPAFRSRSSRPTSTSARSRRAPALDDAGEVAALLAREKAQGGGGASIPDRLVLGADQTLALGERRFSKPADRAGARAQLAALRGQTHTLHSAVAVVRDGAVLFEHVDAAHLTMRAFSDDFLDAISMRPATPRPRASAAISSKASASNCSSASRAIISPCSACRCCRCSHWLRRGGHAGGVGASCSSSVSPARSRMGKTTTAQLFAEEGVPVHDADAAVHQLYEGEAAPLIEAAFPGTTADGKVDRTALGAARARRRGGAAAARSDRASAGAAGRDEVPGRARRRAARRSSVLDIPLLFETGGESRVDAVVVVSAPAEMQRARVLERGMTPEQLEALLARQMPDAEKRRRADFVVDSAQGIEHARAQVRQHSGARLLRCRPRRKLIRRRWFAKRRDLDARDRLRHRNHRPRSRPGRSAGRDRLHRAGQPHSRPARRSTATSIRNATCRPRPSRCTASSVEFLKDKPLFAHMVDELIAFLGDAPLVAHNAMFDLGFLNAELERARQDRRWPATGWSTR